MLTCEDKHAKSCNLTLSAPNEILVSEIDDFDSKEMNEEVYKNIKTSNMQLKSEASEKIESIEKLHNTINMSKSKEINRMHFSSDFLKLAEIEENNENVKLSAFFKFRSDQILMNIVNFNERTYPANSFTIICVFNLHSNRSAHNEK